MFNLNRYDFMVHGDGQRRDAGNFAAVLLDWMKNNEPKDLP